MKSSNCEKAIYAPALACRSTSPGGSSPAIATATQPIEDAKRLTSISPRSRDRKPRRKPLNDALQENESRSAFVRSPEEMWRDGDGAGVKLPLRRAEPYGVGESFVRKDGEPQQFHAKTRDLSRPTTRRSRLFRRLILNHQRGPNGTSAHQLPRCDPLGSRDTRKSAGVRSAP